MPQAVVDDLEAVEVEEQQRHIAADALSKSVGETVGEQGAVGEAGQWILEGLPSELFLVVLALADVAVVENQAVSVVDVGGAADGHLEGRRLAVCADEVQFDERRPDVRVEAAADGLDRPVLVRRHDQVEEAGADQGVGVVAQGAFDGRALVGDPPVGVDQREDVRCVVHHGPEPLLARPQCLLRCLALLHLPRQSPVGVVEVGSHPSPQGGHQGDGQPEQPDGHPEHRLFRYLPGPQRGGDLVVHPGLGPVVERLEGDLDGLQRPADVLTGDEVQPSGRPTLVEAALDNGELVRKGGGGGSGTAREVGGPFQEAELALDEVPAQLGGVEVRRVGRAIDRVSAGGGPPAARCSSPCSPWPPW